MKRLLEAAAERERRSLTNMLEVLVEDYCKRHGISDESVGSSKNAAAKEKKTA